jgi:hypothetical protein
LNEARENLGSLVDVLHTPSERKKPRTYRQKARQTYLNTAKKKSKTKIELRKAIGKQLRYIKRDLSIIDTYFPAGKTVPANARARYDTIIRLYLQQDYMYRTGTHQVEDRIVSLSQPWVRPIVRGKARVNCEFGAKLDISVSYGFTRLENTSFDAYNEGKNLIENIDRAAFRPRQKR